MTTYRIRVTRSDYIDESPRDWDNVGTMACWHSRYTLGDEQPSCDPSEYWLGQVREHDDTGLIDALADYFSDPMSCTMVDVRQMVHNDFHNIRQRYSNRDRASETWELYRAAQRVFAEHGDMDGYVRHLVAEHYVVLPLNLYDHGGITMSTSGFSCPWDSGQVGFIYASHDKAMEEWGPSPEPQKETDIEYWSRRLDDEVKVYDQFLTGDVYDFEVERAVPYVKTYTDGEREEGVDWEHVDSCCNFYMGDGDEDLAACIGDHVSAPADIVLAAVQDIDEWQEWEEAENVKAA